MHTFTSFDGTRIAYRDEGNGPAVILLHGCGVDALGQFGEFERIFPWLEIRQAMFREAFGAVPPLPDPPLDGGWDWPMHSAVPALAPSCRTYAGSELPTTVRKKRL